MKPKSIWIVGSGGHASSVLQVALDLGFNILGVYDPFATASHLHSIPIRTDLESLGLSGNTNIFVAIGDNYSRCLVVKKEIASKSSEVQFPTLIHPSAVVASTATIGSGVVLFQGVVVSAFCRIGDFCFLNTQSSLDHESIMDPFSSLAPGVHIGGRCHVGSRSAVCIGATVAHGLSVGSDTIIGAQSNQLISAKPNSLYYGNPSRWISRREPDERYL